MCYANSKKQKSSIMKGTELPIKKHQNGCRKGNLYIITKKGIGHRQIREMDGGKLQ